MPARIPLPAPSAVLGRRRFLLAAGIAPLLAACGGGGGSAGGNPPDDAPAGGGSYAVVPSPFVASQHSASLAGDGSVILVGGSRGETTLSASIDRFDPATRVFQRIGSLEMGRTAHRATSLGAGSILITGGLRSMGDSRMAEQVNEATGAVQAAGSMSVTRVDHAALRLPDGRVLVTGGYSSGERATLGISDSADIWDPATRSFRRLTERMHIARAAHAMTLLPDGRVLVTGGYTNTTGYLFAEIFDPQTESFTAIAGTQPLRANHAAHLAPDGRVLLLGGETLGDGGQTIIPLASVLAWTAGGITTLPALATPRTWAASVMLPSGEVLLFGGQKTMPEYTATAERYQPAQGGTPIASLDGERALHTATRLPDGRVFIAGGEAFGGAYCTRALLFSA